MRLASPGRRGIDSGDAAQGGLFSTPCNFGIQLRRAWAASGRLPRAAAAASDLARMPARHADATDAGFAAAARAQHGLGC